MRFIATFAIATLIAGPAMAEPYGKWVRASTGATIEFYQCSGKLCAKIAGVKDETKKANVGKVIMEGAAKDGANSWKGTLLNLEDGKTYDGVVTESAAGLNLKGCALAGLVCKDETLTRVK